MGPVTRHDALQCFAAELDRAEAAVLGHRRPRPAEPRGVVAPAQLLRKRDQSRHERHRDGPAAAGATAAAGDHCVQTAELPAGRAKFSDAPISITLYCTVKPFDIS